MLTAGHHSLNLPLISPRWLVILAVIYSSRFDLTVVGFVVSFLKICINIYGIYNYFI